MSACDLCLYFFFSGVSISILARNRQVASWRSHAPWNVCSSKAPSTKVWSCFAISALPDAGISSLNALSFQLGFVGAALKNRSQILISKDLFRTLPGLRNIVTLPFCSSRTWQLEKLLNLHFCTVSWIWIFTLIALCKQTVQLLSPCNRIKTHRYALISLWKPLYIMFVAFVRLKMLHNWRRCPGKHFVSSRRSATVVWLTYCAGWSLSRSYCGECDSNTHWGLNCSAERISRRRWLWRDVVVTIVGAGGRKNNGIKGQPDDCSALVRVALLFKRSPKRKANLSKGAQEKHRMIRLHFSQHFWLWSLFCLETCLCSWWSWCEIYTWHMRWIADPMISLSNNRCDSEIKHTYCTSISAFWMFFHVFSMFNLAWLWATNNWL